MGTTIIGIDCATDPKNVGIALARYERGEAKIDCVKSGGDVCLKKWVKDNSPVLLALDAPLGWPAPMAEALDSHAAGERVGTEAKHMFRRATDRIVAHRLKPPLYVGADRIAWTAHAALELLENLRDRENGLDIPLAWDPDEKCSTVRAIEVYPAATLIAHLGKERFKRGAEYGEYKNNKKGGEGKRGSMLSELPGIRPGKYAAQLAANEHAFDAAICVLAGVDFLRGHVYSPDDLELAKKEGWIWVRRPDT